VCQTSRIACCRFAFCESLEPFAAAVFADQVFDVVRGAVPRDHQQVIFVLPVRNAGHRPHLGITDLAFGECLADLRQFGKRVRHPYFLAGRVHADAAFPVEPVRTGVDALELPQTVLIEFVDQHEQFEGGGVEVGAELRDPRDALRM
jgi:hypothetical protein